MELNKKRETDITKLRRELEEQASQHEQSVNSMRAKQNAALQELQEDLDALKKTKSKWVFRVTAEMTRKARTFFTVTFLFSRPTGHLILFFRIEKEKNALQSDNDELVGNLETLEKQKVALLLKGAWYFTRRFATTIALQHCCNIVPILQRCVCCTENRPCESSPVKSHLKPIRKKKRC